MMRKRLMIAITVLVLLLLAVPLQLVFSEEAAKHGGAVPTAAGGMDASLAAAIREELGLTGQEAISADQLQTLTRLDASGRGITSLQGLEKARNLTWLNVANNSLTDEAVPVLTQLHSLQRLDISYNQLHSLSGFDSLQALTVLDVTGNALTSLAPLKSLGGLEVLYAEENLLDLSAAPTKDVLEKIPAVYAARQSTMKADASAIADASLAEAIRAQLNLGANETITQAHLEQLTELSAFDKGITSLSGLEKAVNLRIVNLSGNWISDLSPLQNLPQLARADVSRNLIQTGDAVLSAIEKKGVTVLASNQRAVVTSTQAVSVPDAQLAAAIREALGLSAKQAITQAALSKLTVLAPLNTPVQSLTGLEYAVNLEVLALPRGAVQDLTPLKGLQRLWSVDLSENNIQDLSPLGGLPQLKAVLVQSNLLNLSSGTPAKKQVDAWRAAKITVVCDPQKSTPITAQAGSTARVDRAKGYLSGIPLKTDVSKIGGLVTAGGATLRVVDKNGNPVTAGSLATGMKVQAVVNGTVFDSLTVVIYGDVNGDGNINISDLVQVQQCLFHTRTVDDLFLEAANVTSRTNPAAQDTNVNISDLVVLQQVLFGRALPQ